MFPPSNLICSVTTASPIQTMENTPENTKSVCALLARIDRNKESSRQKIKGPLEKVSDVLALVEIQFLPEVPVFEPFTHATLQDAICVWPSSN